MSPLSQTELTSECKLTREIAKKLKVVSFHHHLNCHLLNQVFIFFLFLPGQKIRELCPDFDRWQKRPLESDPSEFADDNNENIADTHLTALAEVITKLEASADVLTLAQRGRGSALTHRLNVLFSSI